jgi:membrane-associated phospholipid phosphatase
MILLLMSNWQYPMMGIPAFGGTVMVSMYYVLIVAVLLAGLVGSARLALGAHEPGQVYLGYVAGFGAVVLGYIIL